MPIIRRAETRDLPALAALAAKLFSGDEAEHFAEFSQLLPCADAALFLCEEGGAPAGFAQAQLRRDRAEIERAALEVYHAYSVRDLGRVDMIWDGGCARCFEVDVSPGMTSRSLFPAAIEAAGLSLSAVLNELVETAYERGVSF